MLLSAASTWCLQLSSPTVPPWVGVTPLITAAGRGDSAVVSLLLADPRIGVARVRVVRLCSCTAGASLNSQVCPLPEPMQDAWTAHAWTALHIAAAAGHTAIARSLLLLAESPQFLRLLRQQRDAKTATRNRSLVPPMQPARLPAHLHPPSSLRRLLLPALAGRLRCAGPRDAEGPAEGPRRARRAAGT